MNKQSNLGTAFLMDELSGRTYKSPNRSHQSILSISEVWPFYLLLQTRFNLILFTSKQPFVVRELCNSYTLYADKIVFLVLEMNVLNDTMFPALLNLVEWSFSFLEGHTRLQYSATFRNVLCLHIFRNKSPFYLSHVLIKILKIQSLWATSLTRENISYP